LIPLAINLPLLTFDRTLEGGEAAGGGIEVVKATEQGDDLAVADVVNGTPRSLKVSVVAALVYG
jgi:hypothetical protein